MTQKDRAIADTETHHNVVSFSHNLGYKPFCLMYWGQNGSAYSGDQWVGVQNMPHNCYEFIVFNATTTQFTIDYYYFNSGGGDGHTGLASTNFNFKFYVLINPGS